MKMVYRNTWMLGALVALSSAAIEACGDDSATTPGGGGDGGNDATTTTHDAAPEATAPEASGGEAGVDATGDDATDEPPVTCTGGQVNCGGTCIDPKTNGQYCGASGSCGGGAGGSAGTACDSDAGEMCINGACGVTCQATQTVCGGPDSGADAGHEYCSSLNDVNNCGACGHACSLSEDCVAGDAGPTCVTCTPSVVMVAQPNAPSPPSGWKIACMPDNFAGPCPVVMCGQVATWIPSDINNGEDFGVTSYSPEKMVIKGPAIENGDRYINTITLDSGAQTATLVGQAGGAGITVPWSLFRVP
jgi:hypothetical protein